MADYIGRLGRQELEAKGITGWNWGFADQVRFYELDALNHVNNVVFLKWFETARVRYVQDLGLTSYGPGDPQLVIRHQTADYFAPMHQNESYVVTARTSSIKSSSLVMDYAAYAEGECRASGSAVLVSLEQDGKTRRPHVAEAVARIIEEDGAARG